MTDQCCSRGACCCQPTITAVTTKLSFKDRLGGWAVRWGIGRMRYSVEPGLYAVGKPKRSDPVLVSANYKLTFDSLRKALSGINCYLLILDTKGVNVWCSAGKGTFGTAELVSRIKDTLLSEIVSHQTVILPQLGAVGVDANEVKKQSGFSVIYGPVRAEDIKTFLQNNCTASDDMRTVRFTLRDRLVLTPLELVTAVRKSLAAFGVVFVVNLFAAKPFGLTDFTAYMGAVLTGTVVVPLLLPYIPGRAFAFKGTFAGLIWAFAAVWLNHWISHETGLVIIGYLLLLPSVSAYLAMNFTGASTYTSPSGVVKEMKTALPYMITASAAGLILIGLGRLFGL